MTVSFANFCKHLIRLAFQKTSTRKYEIKINPIIPERLFTRRNRCQILNAVMESSRDKVAAECMVYAPLARSVRNHFGKVSFMDAIFEHVSCYACPFFIIGSFVSSFPLFLIPRTFSSLSPFNLGSHPPLLSGCYCFPYIQVCVSLHASFHSNRSPAMLA